MRAKIEIIRLYPDMGTFTIKAFYEKDEAICAAIQESYHKYFNLKADKTRLNLDPDQFSPGLDVAMMYREMYWASEGYLWETVQRGNMDIDQMEKDSDCAVMMTMHSAKGLEFPTVFIVGVEENIFPGTRSIGDPAEIEEERRLCYVGMTRAKEKLYLTAAKQRMLFGRTSCNSVSRFVKEIPENCLETIQAVRNVSSYQSSGGAYNKPKSGSYSVGGYSYSAPAAPAAKYSLSSKPAAAPAPTAAFRKGDSIVHKAFGAGVISSMQEMGGDFLVEIIFDKVGTKRLMLKSASQYMKKAD